MLINTAQLCEIFQVTERAVTKWIEAGLPVHHQGGQGRGDQSFFHVGDVHRWLLKRAVDRATRETPDARLKELQRAKLEMEIAERAGKLVFAADVERMLTEAIVAARTELLTLADRLKARLDATYRVNIDPAIIEAEVLTALRKLSENPPLRQDQPLSHPSEDDDDERAD